MNVDRECPACEAVICPCSTYVVRRVQKLVARVEELERALRRASDDCPLTAKVARDVGVK